MIFERVDERNDGDYSIYRQAVKDGVLNSLFRHYVHKVDEQIINCPNMTKLKSNNPLHCDIYYAMKENDEYNLDNL